MEKICIVCRKIPTNHPDGKCVMCRINGKLPTVNEHEDNSPAIRKPGIEEKQSKIDSRLRGNDRTKKEKKMEAKDYHKHQKCSVETCEKYVVKDGLCVAHYKEKHGESPYVSNRNRLKELEEIITI